MGKTHLRQSLSNPGHRTPLGQPGFAVNPDLKDDFAALGVMQHGKSRARPRLLREHREIGQAQTLGRTGEGQAAGEGDPDPRTGKTAGPGRDPDPRELGRGETRVTENGLNHGSQALGMAATDRLAANEVASVRKAERCGAVFTGGIYRQQGHASHLADNHRQVEASARLGRRKGYSTASTDWISGM
jgi:hypothetical protein